MSPPNRRLQVDDQVTDAATSCPEESPRQHAEDAGYGLTLSQCAPTNNGNGITVVQPRRSGLGTAGVGSLPADFECPPPLRCWSTLPRRSAGNALMDLGASTSEPGLTSETPESQGALVTAHAGSTGSVANVSGQVGGNGSGSGSGSGLGISASVYPVIPRLPHLPVDNLHGLDLCGLGRGQLEERANGTSQATGDNGTSSTAMTAFPEPVSLTMTLWQKLRHQLTRLVVSHGFDVTIVVVILANTATLAMVYHGASAEWNYGLIVCNYVFTAIFTFEVLLKLVALGPRFVVFGGAT